MPLRLCTLSLHTVINDLWLESVLHSFLVVHENIVLKANENMHSPFTFLLHEGVTRPFDFGSDTPYLEFHISDTTVHR